MKRSWPLLFILAFVFLTSCQVNLPFSKKRLSVRAPASVDTPEALFFNQEISPQELEIALGVCKDLRAQRMNRPFLTPAQKKLKTSYLHRSCDNLMENKVIEATFIKDNFSDVVGPLAEFCSKVFHSEGPYEMLKQSDSNPLVVKYQFGSMSDRKRSVTVTTFAKETGQEELVFKEQDTYIFGESREVSKRGTVEKWVKEKTCGNTMQIERWEQKILP